MKNGQPPTYDEVQAEGKRLEDAAQKKKKTKGKTASAEDPLNGSGGTFRVLTGEGSVRLGKLELPAAYADASCVHTGGGHPVEGSDTVCVGRGQWKFSRVTDATSDDYALTTGEDTVGIG